MCRSAPSLVALLACAAPSTAAEHDGSICEWVLGQTAAQSVLESPVRDFLSEHTALFDLMERKASIDERSAPYWSFYATEIGEPESLFDFITESAVIHATSARTEGCIQIEGKLSGNSPSDGTPSVDLTFRDKRTVPVTLFVYNSREFAQDARQGEGTDETNVRVKVGSLDLVPENSLPGTSVGRNDPFQTFYLSAYLRRKRDTTITGSASSDGTKRAEGESVWFVGDIGAGPQLLAAICDGPCIDLQRPLVKLPKFHANAEAAGLSASSEADGMESETSVTEITDFAGERFILRDATNDQNIVSRLLEESTADMLESNRAIIALYLDKLGGSEAPAALEELSNAGLVGIELEHWEFEGYERRHVVTLQPAGPEHLTAVRLVLSEPPSSSVLQNCVPKVEIAHADHDRAVIPMNLDLDSKFGDTYTEFEVKIKGDDPVLAQSPDSLSLRIFVEAGNGDEPTCSLTWNAFFPEDVFHLADRAESMPDRFELTSVGEAVFSGVELVSTQRAAYILIFNKTGPVDENGQPASAEAYPKWNFKFGGDELAHALTRIREVAHAAYSDRTSAVFTVTGAGADTKSFGTPTPLTGDRAMAERVTLLDGGLGIESLEFAIAEVVHREKQPPIIVVIGRSGLGLDSDYCASVPGIPASARMDSVVIDFVPSAAVSALPSETRAAFESGGGSDLSDDIIRRMPAARCPKSGSDELAHWILVPDEKIFPWSEALDSLARQIFAGIQ